MSKTWSVIKFPEEGTVEAVPTSWLEGSMCYWPSLPKKQTLLAIQSCQSPQKDWQLYTFESFRNNVFRSFKEARNKLLRATKTSDLESDSQSVSGKRIIFKKMYSSSEEEEEEEPLPEAPSLKSTKNKISFISGGNQLTPTSRNLVQDIVVNSGSSNVVRLDNHTKSVTPTGNHAMDVNLILEHLTKILKKQNLLQGMLSDVMSEMDLLKKQLNRSSIQNEETSHSIFTEVEYLPINNQEDLDKFEQFLNDTNMNRTAMELSKIGGTTIYEFVFRTGVKLISNKFAGAEYSFLGRKTKKSFRDLKLAQLVMKAAQKAFPEATQKCVEKEMAKWLKRCTERGKKENTLS